MKQRKLGHEIIFIYFNSCWSPGSGGPELPDFDLCPIEKAEQEQWDAVMIPGAGFPALMIKNLSRLVNPIFGKRIQHVLNDRSKQSNFIHVNKIFRPHLLVFNNKAAWPDQYLPQFMSDAIFFLEGAVDYSQFCTPRNRPHPSIDHPLIVGGLSYKNPDLLLEAVRRYPYPITLKLFGTISPSLDSQSLDLKHQGKLILIGPLEDSELPEFYQSVDCIVHMDQHAGWANLAAEAMASCVPLICTQHGTQAFAKDKESALVMKEITADEIMTNLEIIHLNREGFAEKLARAGRDRIQAFTWKKYSKELLQLIQQATSKFYIRVPEMGLHGKWSLDTRLNGLQPVIDSCENRTILDLGAAECTLAEIFIKAGAQSIDCVDMNKDYYVSGKRILAPYPNATMHLSNLCPWEKFLLENQIWLCESYDIVLFLGVYHHLPKSQRKAVLLGAAKLAKDKLIMRTPDSFFSDENLLILLQEAGFSCSHTFADDATRSSGGLHILQRIKLVQTEILE